MQLPITEMENMQILGLTLEYLDSSTVPDFKEQIPMNQLKTEKILLDLSQLQFIDSTGLGSIIGFNKRLLEKGQRLGLVSANHQVESIFGLVKLHKIIPIFETIDDAAEQVWT